MEKKNNNKLPGIRIAITPDCNLACYYCIPGGESYLSTEKKLNQKDFLKILKVAADMGLRDFVFTGGEPLLKVKEVAEISKNLQAYNKNVKIRVTTNGVNLKQNVNILKKLKLNKLIVSLDTLDPKKFEHISRKPLLDKVINGINTASEILPLRINVVLTKENQNEIFDLINYCAKKKIDMKILDLNYFKSTGAKYWDKKYCSLNKLIKELKSIATSETKIRGPGKYGIPMHEFVVKGIKIRVKYSALGTTYSIICKNCDLYPSNNKIHYCQEGIYKLFLVASGKLRICKHRADISFDFSKIDLNNKAEVKAGFEKILTYYYDSLFIDLRDYLHP